VPGDSDNRTGFVEVVGFLDKEPFWVGTQLVSPGIIGTYEQMFEIVGKYFSRPLPFV
jgi:hypothetical protein